jgi:putative spermidine/putrescine transport system ATP-binding protein
VSKKFGDLTVLDGVDLSVQTGEMVSIVGPSGAGKTTLLKLCARLLQPDEGTVFIESGERRIRSSRQADPILVFQDYLLFPYLNVFENVAFGLRARRVSRVEIRRRVREILSFFAIEEKEEEYPATLSGGQRQRVALARALVLRPSLLLLDEPFANLDQNLKMDTAMFLQRTQREFGNITTLCVTHDMEEACAMSDKVGVMLDGRILDYGAPERIFSAPANLETARFLGPVNSVPKRCYPSLAIAEEAEEIYILPNAVELISADSLDPNAGRARGTVRDVRFTGKTYETTVDTEGYRLTVRSVEKPPQQGSEVHLNIRTYLVPFRTHGPSRENGERVDGIFGLRDRSMSNGGGEMLVQKSPPATVPQRVETKATAKATEKEEVIL